MSIQDRQGNYQKYNSDGSTPVVVVGSLPKSEMEGYGSTVADRPLATSVPIGYMFKAVTTQEVWQSDGANWVVIM